VAGGPPVVMCAKYWGPLLFLYIRILVRDKEGDADSLRDILSLHTSYPLAGRDL
jgi:hypothetical protein